MADRFKLFSFTVAGRIGQFSSFPLDMLRYDACWPADNDAVAELHNQEPRQNVCIRLLSHRPPTDARWRSFGWVVKHR